MVRRPGDRIERELRARLGESRRRTILAGAVLATAALTDMACVARAGLVTGDAT